jgi:hypothetical protein
MTKEMQKLFFFFLRVTKMKVSFAKETLDRCKVKRECGKFP